MKNITVIMIIILSSISLSTMSMMTIQKYNQQQKQTAQAMMRACINNGHPIGNPTMIHLSPQEKAQARQHNQRLANQQAKK